MYVCKNQMSLLSTLTRWEVSSGPSGLSSAQYKFLTTPMLIAHLSLTPCKKRVFALSRVDKWVLGVPRGDGEQYIAPFSACCARHCRRPGLRGVRNVSTKSSLGLKSRWFTLPVVVRHHRRQLPPTTFRSHSLQTNGHWVRRTTGARAGQTPGRPGRKTMPHAAAAVWPTGRARDATSLPPTTTSIRRARFSHDRLLPAIFAFHCTSSIRAGVYTSGSVIGSAQWRGQNRYFRSERMGAWHTVAN